MQDVVLCPSCGTPIQISQALRQQVGQEVRSEFERQNFAQQEKFEEELRRQQQLFESEKKQLEHLFAQRFSEQLKAQEHAIRLQIENDLALRQKDILNALQEKEEKLRAYEHMVLDLHKEQRERDERERELRLEMEKKLNESLQESYLKAQKQIAEQYEMQLRERDKLNDDLRKKIEELQMKVRVSSAQVQGEIAELHLESLLKDAFPLDSIEPIARGKFGADVVHKVRDQYGRLCGVILWESKQTKSWQSEWLSKLRDDLRSYKAHIAVLVTLKLPDDIATFGLKDGIWVTNRDSLLGLATALRYHLIMVAYERHAGHGKGEKMEMVYNYLLGHEFRQKIEAIVEAFTEMRHDLEREKVVQERIWKKREMQLTRLAVNTSRMYGDMQGLVGSALPTVDGLELPDQSEALPPNSLFDTVH